MLKSNASGNSKLEELSAALAATVGGENAPIVGGKETFASNAAANLVANEGDGQREDSNSEEIAGNKKVELLDVSGNAVVSNVVAVSPDVSVALPQPPTQGHTENKVPSIEEVVLIDPDCIELELNHHRIDKLDNFEPLTRIECLYLRWNLIKKIENLNTLTTLLELELYDNQITKIENLEALVNLKILDISFNRVSKIENLGHLTKLEKLYLCANKIPVIENLSNLTNLTMLELGDNKIKKIENLETLVNLRQLYLGKNKIVKIENLDKLVSLECLSLQANRIVKIENLENLRNLNELYLSENGIELIENLSANTELETLDLAKNRLKSIDNLEDLKKLQELWLNNNSIYSWGNLEVLKANTGLATVYLETNPVAKDPMYRFKLRNLLPWIKKIDATLCR